MDVHVHGRNVHVGDRLRSLAERKVAKASRFFENVGDADVEFSEEANPRNAAKRHSVEISAPAAGQIVRAAASAESPSAALDKAVDRFGASLRRLHDRLIDRNRKAGKKDLNLTSQDAEDQSDSDGIDVVRVKQFVMKPMTPEDAAMQMEQLGHNFFFFLNGETMLQSVLYRRRDGRFGLIETA